MPTDWTIDPTMTQTAPDGGRREWACREIAPPDPIPQPVVTMPAPGDVVADPPQTARLRWRMDNAPDIGKCFGTDAAFAQAQRNSDMRFGATIASADRDLAAGRWSWRAILLCIFLCGGSGWVIIVSVWGTPDKWNSAPVQSRDSSTRAGLAFSESGGRGDVNRCRALLILWLESPAAKRLRPEELDAARQAIREDRP